MTHDSPASRRARVRLVQGLTCDVKGCSLPVTGLSRYCDDHDKANERYGHPLGRLTTIGELKPYRTLAREFIDQHHDHPGIRAALDWIARLITETPEPRHIHQRSTPEQRLGRFMGQMRRGGVDPRDFLAVVAGMALLREWRPYTFKSDRHFAHQTAIRVLRLIPAPHVARWSGDKVRRNYDRVTVGARELLSKRLGVALGLLCLRIARTIVAELNKPDPDHLPGADAPFTPTTTTNPQARN